MAELKHFDDSEVNIPGPDGLAAGLGQETSKINGQASTLKVAHPSGKKSYGKSIQIVRAVLLAVYFFTCSTIVFLTQCIGSPLYFVNREWYYGYIAMTKRHFAILTTVMTQIWGPVTIRVSGDESVAGQIKPVPGGNIEFHFPERIILIANHQIYTDWLYLWWIGYANSPGMHGHIFIILKESLKYIPILGWGMMFYGFIFMSRKMATDQPRLAYRLNKLKQQKTDPHGKTYLDPMWLLLFPEGTNLSGNGRRKSANWAAKNGLRDPEHVMLPRSTGIFFCLNELKGSLEYVYDCTVAYEGIPRGKYGEDYFGLSSTYLEGRSPKSVNFYWRRFRIADIPLHDQKAFDLWLRDQWYKKDELMEMYYTSGRFPEMPGPGVDFVETTIRTRHPWEILQLFSVIGIVALIWRNIKKGASFLFGR